MLVARSACGEAVAAHKHLNSGDDPVFDLISEFPLFDQILTTHGLPSIEPRAYFIRIVVEKYNDSTFHCGTFQMCVL
jgi:hypothetical protein